MKIPVAALLLGLSPFALAQAPQVLPPASATVSLPTQHVPSSYVDLGPAPATLTAGHVLLFLNRSAEQQAKLDALISEQSDPSSPNYRNFLSPTQFGEQFGPSDTEVTTVAQWLVQNGFTVTRTLRSRLAIEFLATAPQLEAVFQTHIHAFSSSSDPGTMVYANTTSPRIPTALGSLVKTVSLSNFGPHPLNRSLGSFLLHPALDPIAPLHATALSADAAEPLDNLPNYQPCAPTGDCYALVPGDYATIYDTKPLLAQGIDGTGVTIGIVSTSNIDLPTVQRFRTLFLPNYSATNLPNVILDGADPGQATAGTNEAYIDVETAAGVAPNATINLYTGANSAYTNGLTLALARAIEDNAVSILSVSYGECEAYLGSYNSQYRDFYEEAAAQGITVVVSSGDSGSSDCDPPPGTSVSGSYLAQNGLAVDGLASTPYNVAVGGTDFLYPAKATSAQLNQYWNTPSASSTNNNADWSSALSYIPEKPWEDSNPILNQLNNGQYTGGGGGQSSCAFNDGGSPAVCQGGYSKPAWQQGFGNDTVRDVPDVSFFAATGSNYSFYAFCTYYVYNSGPSECATTNAGPNSTTAPILISGFGGTSVSTPLFAGILALVAQKTHTTRLGLVTPTLYPLSKQFPSVFHDITTGTNGTSCAPGSPNCGSNGFLTGYSASTGFDLATGLGSVDANQLVSNWSNITSSTQATTTTLALTPVTAAHEAVITFTVNVTGTTINPPSGTIAILTGSGLTIQTTHECAAFPCTFTYNKLPGGSYPVVARFLANGVYSSSTSAAVTVTITPEASEVLILNSFYNNQANVPNGLNGHTDVQIGETLGFIIAPVPSSTPANATFASLNSPPATGTVTITDAGSPIGSPIRLDTTGLLSFNSSTFALGPHSLVAQYSGDGSYSPSSTIQPVSTPLNFTVIKATTSIQVSGLPLYGGTAVGYPLTLNLYVPAVYSSVGQTLPNPSGTLVVTVNGTALPPVNLSAAGSGLTEAIATIPGNLIVLGANAIVVTYSGDANYASISEQVSVTGIVFQTSSFLNLSPQTTSAGSPVTMYLEVQRSYLQANPLTIPTNVSITLLDGATPFATVPLATDQSRTSADGQFSYSGLTAGTHTITAQYAGDSGDLPSSATKTIVITPGAPGFTLAATPVTIAGGTSNPSASSTLTVTPVNGFTGTMTLGCSAGSLPSGSCSVPSSTTITGTTPVTVNVSISIRGSVAQLERPTGLFLASLPIATACLLLASFGRRRLPLVRFLSAVGVAVLLAGLSGCGSGGTTSIPAGAYNVTIQATSGNISQSATIPVTVQ